MADPLRMVDDYPLYIGGQWIEPRTGRYDDISPSSEATIARAPDADLDDVDAEAVGIANNSQYGLSGAVWGGDVDRAVAVARRVRTGQIAVNGCMPGDAPFGGFNQSGLGREGGGLGGLHRYMESKAIGIPV